MREFERRRTTTRDNGALARLTRARAAARARARAVVGVGCVTYRAGGSPPAARPREQRPVEPDNVRILKMVTKEPSSSSSAPAARAGARRQSGRADAGRSGEQKARRSGAPVRAASRREGAAGAAVGARRRKRGRRRPAPRGCEAWTRAEVAALPTRAKKRRVWAWKRHRRIARRNVYGKG